jgi:hypothetical protein
VFTRVVLVVALVACAGCVSDNPTVDGSPSTPAESPPPTGPPLGTVTMRSGQAAFTIEGDFTGTFSLDTVSTPAIYRALPADVAISWGDGWLTVRGPLAAGEQTTGETLELSLGVAGDGPAPETTVSSVADECTIAVASADDHSLAGSFECRGLGGRSLDAAGTFSASA